jgi:hypothetical protein
MEEDYIIRMYIDYHWEYLNCADEMTYIDPRKATLMSKSEAENLIALSKTWDPESTILSELVRLDSVLK